MAESKKSLGDRTVDIPNWSIEDLRLLTLLDALRLDALTQLLEKKGVFTHEELLAGIESSISNRFQKVISGLQGEPEAIPSSTPEPNWSPSTSIPTVLPHPKWSIKEAATKINDVAGAGTTTATVLAQAIVKEGLNNVAAGANPMLLKRGIDKASDAVVARIKEMATPINGKEDIAHIATISAADPEVGNLIAEVMDKVGKDGVITVEESKGLRFESEFVEGMNFDQGYISPYFTTNSDRMEAVLEEPYILITDKKISAFADIAPVLERALHQGRRELLIIAEDVEGEALATLVVNKLGDRLNVLAVKAPGFGDRRKEILRDIASLTGAQVISEETGRKLDSTQVSDLGRARRVISNKDETTIVEGHGKESEIQGRIKAIKAQVEETTSDYDREKLQERLAKLSGGVAVIKVGAATEVELKEKKHRVEDALLAARAAIEEGIVPGGGVALINAAAALDGVKLEGDEATGVAILRRAMEEPLKQIAENAGQDGSVILQLVRRIQSEQDNTNWGYNVVANDYMDLVKAGVIDLAKVTRSAIENASSIAGMTLTTEALITEIPEKENLAVTRLSAAPPGVIRVDRADMER